MESSRHFDLPAVLKPEFEKRLVRVFAHIRQHERKAKLTRKTAELNSLKEHARRVAVQADLSRSSSGCIDGDSSTREREDSKDQLVARTSHKDATLVGQSQDSVGAELEREIEEFRKTINLKDFETTGLITAADVMSVFRALNHPLTKAEAQWVIWEVDDDLDGYLDWDEFRGAYARGVVDRQGTEPNQLFYLIQFILSDPDGGGTVSVADIKTELQRIRGTDHLAAKIKNALGAVSERSEQDRHPLGHFLDSMLAHIPASFAVSNHFPPK